MNKGVMLARITLKDTGKNQSREGSVKSKITRFVSVIEGDECVWLCRG